jgi:ketosteroid isomerase-like protein
MLQRSYLDVGSSGIRDKALWQAQTLRQRSLTNLHNNNSGRSSMNIRNAGLALAALMVVSGPAVAGEDAKVAAEVMALARAQWAAEVAGKSMAEQSASTAADYTEFNPDYPALIVGKELADRLTAASVSDGSRTLAADMVNPRVQVYGDTAILTYNFVGVGRDKDGKNAPGAAKSTRVYAKMDGKWMLVHANFAPAAMKY